MRPIAIDVLPITKIPRICLQVSISTDIPDSLINGRSTILCTSQRTHGDLPSCVHVTSNTHCRVLLYKTQMLYDLMLMSNISNVSWASSVRYCVVLLCVCPCLLLCKIVCPWDRSGVFLSFLVNFLGWCAIHNNFMYVFFYITKMSLTSFSLSSSM